MDGLLNEPKRSQEHQLHDATESVMRQTKRRQKIDKMGYKMIKM